LKIFISHSSVDVQLAESLANLLRLALPLSPEEIRCTSVDGYRLPVGVDTDERLRREVRDSSIFLALITPTSIRSAYVLFELGARWGANLPLFPVLGRGASIESLDGPLSGINALSLVRRQDVLQLIEDIGHELQMGMVRPSSIDTMINEMCAVALEEEIPPVLPNGLENLFSTDHYQADQTELEIIDLEGNPLNGAKIEIPLIFMIENENQIGIPIYYAHRNLSSSRVEIRQWKLFANEPLVRKQRNLNKNGYTYVRDFRENITLPIGGVSSEYFSTYRISKNLYSRISGEHMMRFETYSEDKLVAHADFTIILNDEMPIRHFRKDIFYPIDYLREPSVKLNI